MKKTIKIALNAFIFLQLRIYALGIGSNAAYPYVENVLKTFPITGKQLYFCSNEEIEALVNLASEIEINIFELLDCTYRYLLKNNMRVEIKGEAFKRLMPYFDYGEERMLSLFPVPQIEKIQTGSVFTQNQNALDVYLKEPYSTYIEIGTAFYNQHFGFKKIEPNLFSSAYGMTVKKLGIKKAIEKIHLYENGKGAIYAKGFYRPKKWNFWLITKIAPSAAGERN